MLRKGEITGQTNIGWEQLPVHRVVISHAFQMGKYEITQGQYMKVIGGNPSWFSGDDNRPVEQVSWEGLRYFLAVVNALNDGYAYRLPTEAEWEYACRAGTTGDFAGNLDEMAWYSENAGGTTHPVGTKKPNAFGLYDMHGNVDEWVQDWYDQAYYQYCVDHGVVTDPPGPSNDSGQLHFRVNRGGRYNDPPGYLTSGYRMKDLPYDYSDGLGFRLVRTPK